MSRFWSLLLCALCGLFVGSRATANIAPSSTSSAPLNFSYVLFPAFANIDVFAPVDGLALLSLRTQLNLFFLSDTLDPVSSEPQSAAMNAYNSSFGSTIVPTHTFDTAPPIDVLLVPGGLGTRAPAPQLDPHTAFIRNVYPSLQYIISICTGGGLLARQCVVDQRRERRARRRHGMGCTTSLEVTMPPGWPTAWSIALWTDGRTHSAP